MQIISHPKATGLIAIALTSALLTGCETVAPVFGCTATKDSSGNVTGEVKCPLNTSTKSQLASMPIPARLAIGRLPEGWLAQVAAPVSPSTFDALLLRLSTQGTNIPMSSTSGNFTVTLYQGSTPVASSVFGWIRNGSDLIASQPSVVTAWVRQFPNADGFTADVTLSFTATTASTATVQAATVYNGTTYASSSQSFPMPRKSGGTNMIEQ